MKKSIFKTQICAITLSILIISCEKEKEVEQTSEKMMIETLVPIDINERGATLKANVISAGNAETQAIGFVYWDPTKFNLDLNPFFDTTSLMPGEIMLGTVGGDVMLGTVGGDVMIDSIESEIFLGTVGGDVMLGTVGNDVRFPGDAFEDLLEKIKIINNQKKGDFKATVKQLKFNTKYSVRAFIKSRDGIIYAKSQVFETKDAGIKPGNGVTDIRGNTYPSLIINGLEWMAENLKTDRYADNTIIPHPTGTGSGLAWLNDSVGMRMNPNQNNTFWEDYGYLYNWHATQNTSKLCPDGWRMPTKQEWDDLLIYLGGANVAGSAMKTKGNEWWKDKNEDATNSSGFSVRGAGNYSGHVSAYAAGFQNEALFWSDTQIGTTSDGIPIPEHYKFTKENGKVTSNENTERPHAQAGASVRCVKD